MRAVAGVIWITYPILVLLGLNVLGTRWLALGIGVLLALHLAVTRSGAFSDALRPALVPAAGVAVAIGLALLFDLELGLFLVPVLVNAGLLLGFGRSLVTGPPIVERLARIQVADLPDDEVRYCRSVTWVWCGFFVLNGSVILALALLGDAERWALYTGLVSYLLMGALFALEFSVRAWRFDRHVGTPVEPLFRRLLGRNAS